MRIKASEPFSNSVVTNTKTGGTSALELSPSQETLATATTSNTKNATGATTAMTPHLQEPNVKKETAEWSANIKEQHNTHLISSSPLVEQLSLEERELGTANSNTYKIIESEPKCECNANIALASTNLVHTTEETAHGDPVNRVGQKNIGSMECNSSCSASSNCFTSIMDANSQSAPSVISASPSPPPLLNSSAYTAAALHGKRLPPSRQRSGYSVNALNAINKTNNNKTNSLFGRNNVNNNSNTCTKPFENMTKDDNCSNNKFTETCRRNIHNGCERTNCEESVNCKDANNSISNKHCDQRQENNTVEQTCASLSSNQEVYREAKSAPLPSTNTINNANENDKSATVAEQTNNDKNNASKTNNTTHCNTHLRHANLYINLPSSFVRSSQLCDSEVESVITTSSSSSSSFSNIITSGNIDGDGICSRRDSFTSSSSNNSNSANKKRKNNRSHLCYSDDCGTNHFHPFYAHYRNTFRNDRNGRNRHPQKYLKETNSCDAVQSNDCKVCNGDVKHNGEHNEVPIGKSYSNSITQRRDNCTFNYLPRRRHLSFCTHATPTLDNAELSSNCSCYHSHSAPTYYKRKYRTSTCMQQYCTNSKINCISCRKSEEKSSNSFANLGKNYTTNLTSTNNKDDTITSTRNSSTLKTERCTHSPSLTLLPSSHSEHHAVSSNNNYKNKGIGNKTNDKCTPLSPYSSPHYFHYHNHPDEKNTYTNKNILESEQKVENFSFMNKEQKQMEYLRNDKTEWKENTDNTSNTKNGCNKTSSTIHANISADKSKTRKIVNKHQFHIQVPSEPYCSPQSAELFSLTNPFPPSVTLSTSPNASNISSNVLSSSCTLSRSSTRKAGMKCQTRAQYTNFMHSEFSAVEVLPGLYLGTRVDANDLQLLREHDISLVINVSEDCPVPPAELTNPLHIRVIQFALKDHSDEVIAPFFVPITDIIHQQLHRRQAYQHFMKKQAEIVSSIHANHNAHDNTNITVNTNNNNNNIENNKSCYSIPDSVKPYSSLLHKHNNKEQDAPTTETCTEIKTLNNYIAQDNEQITLQSNNDSDNQSISKTNRKNKSDTVTYNDSDEKEQELNDLVSL